MNVLGIPRNFLGIPRNSYDFPRNFIGIPRNFVRRAGGPPVHEKPQKSPNFRKGNFEKIQFIYTPVVK